MRFLPVSLNALLVELADLDQTLALLASLQREPLPGVLELVLFLEENFGLQVKASEMLPQNFDSVNAITAFVERARSPA